MSPLSIYAVQGLSLAVAIVAVLLILSRMTTGRSFAAFPVPSRRSEFWCDVAVWICSVLYGLAVGAMVAIILGLAWARWGW